MAAPGFKGYTVGVHMMRRLLPIALFALGCFPSRGLYFLLHSGSAEGRYYAHHPVLSAPASPTPKLKPPKVPLPSRLTRVPRTVKASPSVSAPDRIPLFTISPSAKPRWTVADAPQFPPYQAFPSSPPPSRAPPASV